MHSDRNKTIRSLAILLFISGVVGMLSGCASKEQPQDLAKLVDVIDAEISKLSDSYSALKSTAPELSAALADAAGLDLEALQEVEKKIALTVSKSEDSVALIESNLVKLEEAKGAETYKPYVEEEKKAQEKRKKAWAEVKVWWDGYESALQAAGSIARVGRFFAEEFGPEYEKAARSVEQEEWQAAKDALEAADRRLRPQADALATARASLRIEGAQGLTDALDIFGEMIRLTIEFCDAGIVKDEVRQREIANDIGASEGRLGKLEIDPAGLLDEIKRELIDRGPDFDFTKADGLMREAEKLEEKARGAKPKSKKG